MLSGPNRSSARPPVRRSTQPLKKLGEDAAAEFLLDKGLRLIARNWRTRFGELDLVAMEGSTLVFVEVKARKVESFVEPALAVDHRKQRRLRHLAKAFLAFERPTHDSCRFDVISVLSGQTPIRIRHIPNAF